jgi:hypothetical protein
MRSIAISAPLENIPVDFFADPDGCWEFDQLGRVAGFDQAWGQLSIGALSEPYAGFPEGAAVVMLSTAQLCSVVLVDCTASPGLKSQGCERQGFQSQSSENQSSDSQGFQSQSFQSQGFQSQSFERSVAA